MSREASVFSMLRTLNLLIYQNRIPRCINGVSPSGSFYKFSRESYISYQLCFSLRLWCRPTLKLEICEFLMHEWTDNLFVKFSTNPCIWIRGVESRGGPRGSHFSKTFTFHLLRFFFENDLFSKKVDSSAKIL